MAQDIRDIMKAKRITSAKITRGTQARFEARLQANFSENQDAARQY